MSTSGSGSGERIAGRCHQLLIIFLLDSLIVFSL